jgi:hypothetical protein
MMKELESINGNRRQISIKVGERGCSFQQFPAPACSIQLIRPGLTAPIKGYQIFSVQTNCNVEERDPLAATELPCLNLELVGMYGARSTE